MTCTVDFSNSRTEGDMGIAQMRDRQSNGRRCHSGMTSTGRPSRITSGCAGLNDFREIALAEVQVCPDNSRLVTVGQIDQIDGPLRQRILWQQWHQALLPNG